MLGIEVGVPRTRLLSLGSPTLGAVPSYESAMKYFIDTYQWAEEEEIDIFYFSAFDESWKVDKTNKNAFRRRKNIERNTLFLPKIL